MPSPAGRAAARAAPTGGLKGRKSQVRRAGLGPAPTGKRNKARRADTFRPRYRVSTFRGRISSARCVGHPFCRRGGYYPPAAPDTRPFVGAHSVRPRLRGCLRFLRRGNAGAAARAGVRPKGAQAEPGGRPRGPPLRGRRERDAGSGGPVWDRPLRGSGTKPAGRTRSAHGIEFPLFVGADIIRTRYWIPGLGRGGNHPPAVLDTRFFVGADMIRPPHRVPVLA